MDTAKIREILKTLQGLVAPRKVDLAMDAAISAAVERVRSNARELREAERFVRPYVGEVSLALDSAEEVYRQAARMLGIEGVNTIHASALPALIQSQRRPGTGSRINPDVGAARIN